jgi:2-polyprenyl-3-methyl-5-hydroxy-6-metoxy-1,4-benzoquinol methylase
MELRALLTDAADAFPATSSGGYFTLANRKNWVDRTTHDLRLLTARLERPTEAAVADVGGGLGLLAIGCARLGMRATVIDDLALIEQAGLLPATLEILGREGVEVQRRDVLANGLGLDAESVDAVMFMHVIEHLPISPKTLLHEMRDALRPGGVLMIAAPNCVNLRKRITVPVGRGAWSRMEDWYETPSFGGHVREPDLSDLEYIARDLQLRDVEIHGRNFLGFASPSPRRRLFSRIIDPVLRKRPSLCSDLYMVGSR